MRKTISFLSDNLKLEGVLYSPATQSNLAGAIVVHPHPQFGGSMDNKVVDAVCEQLENSMIALKFNLRKVVGRDHPPRHAHQTGKNFNRHRSIPRSLRQFAGYDRSCARTHSFTDASQIAGVWPSGFFVVETGNHQTRSHVDSTNGLHVGQTKYCLA